MLSCVPHKIILLLHLPPFARGEDTLQVPSGDICPFPSVLTRNSAVSGDGRASIGILSSFCWFLYSCSVLCGPGRNWGDPFPVWRVSVLVSEGKKEEPQRFCSCSEKVLNMPCLTSLKQRPSDSEHQPCFRQATSFSEWFRPLPSAGPAWWFAVASTV